MRISDCLPRHRKWGFLIVAGVVALAAVVGRCTRHIVEIGPGEHYEVTKALLWAKGFRLYQDVWNDQPPLYTVLLGTGFATFGTTIGVARGLATVFGLSLVVGVGIVVNRSCGIVAGALSAALAIASPQVLVLCISAMLEVPAIGTGLWAAWPLFQRESRQKWRSLVFSGVLMAAALQIKLTAAIMIPALMAEIVLGVQESEGRSQIRKAAQDLGVWSASVAATYLVLALGCGVVPLETFWTSHFAPETLAHVQDSGKLPFLADMFHKHRDGIWAGGTGLLALAFRSEWRRLMFPIV